MSGWLSCGADARHMLRHSLLRRGIARVVVGTSMGLGLSVLTACQADRVPTSVDESVVHGLQVRAAAVSGLGTNFVLSIRGDTVVTGRLGGEVPVSVVATDSTGRPLSNVLVYFASEGQPANGTPSKATVSTSVLGVAANTWRMGQGVGVQRLKAWLRGSVDTVRWEAEVAGPSGISAVSAVTLTGAFQGSTVVTVQVTDSLGEPFPAAPITFLPDTNAGKVSAATVKSSSNGQAKVTWTFSPTTVGAQRLRALAAGVDDTLEFVATVDGPPVVHTLRTVTDSSLRGITGTTQSLRVQVLDQRGAPMAGARVQFRAMAQSGAVPSAAVTTGSTGMATATWTYGPTPGTHTVLVTATGLSDTLRFDATVTAPPVATRLELVAAEPDSARAGVKVALKVRVLDADSLPFAKAALRWRYLTGTGWISASVQNADAKGIASVDWMPWRPTTVHAISVELAGKPSTALVISSVVTAGAPMVMSMGDGATLQTADFGTSVAVAPTVKIVDLYGNVVPGVEVTFAASSGGSVGQATVFTDVNGVASSGSWTLGPSIASQRLTATSSAKLSRGNPTTFSATGR